jgi:hypothetical protein
VKLLSEDEGLWDAMAVLFNVSDLAKRFGLLVGCLREDVCQVASRWPTASHLLFVARQRSRRKRCTEHCMERDTCVYIRSALGTGPTYPAPPKE